MRQERCQVDQDRGELGRQAFRHKKKAVRGAISRCTGSISIRWSRVIRTGRAWNPDANQPRRRPRKSGQSGSNAGCWAWFICSRWKRSQSRRDRRVAQPQGTQSGQRRPCLSSQHGRKGRIRLLSRRGSQGHGPSAVRAPTLLRLQTIEAIDSANAAIQDINSA